jgi:hypothetical protein
MSELATGKKIGGEFEEKLRGAISTFNSTWS